MLILWTIAEAIDPTQTVAVRGWVEYFQSIQGAVVAWTVGSGVIVLALWIAKGAGDGT